MGLDMRQYWKKRWSFLFIGSCLLFFGWGLKQNQIVELVIPLGQGGQFSLTMPWKDKKSLDYFFQEMFALDDGLYTLFGSKPMSMISYTIPFSTASLGVFLDSLSPYNLRAYWGWKTWQKYQGLLANSNFLLWSEENPFWLRWWDPPSPAVCILLAHKKQLQETVKNHHADFQAVLGKRIVTSAELLLEAKNKPFLKDVLKGHDGLIGTLFGYGRQNAWLFEQRNQGVKVDLAPVWEEDIYEFFASRPTPNWVIYGFASENLSDVLGYPCFLANPDSEETKALKEGFLSCREKIIAHYKGKDVLATTLGLLVAGAPQETQ
jgi:hypothetical protein